MRILRWLGRRTKEPESEGFVASPAQDVPGLQPIVVQAIEGLFPAADDRESAFQYALEYKRVYKKRIGREDLKGLLALLASSRGRIEDLPGPELWFFGRFRIEDIDPMFPKMKDAEEWVRALSVPKT